jgi:hypothetical protein
MFRGSTKWLRNQPLSAPNIFEIPRLPLLGTDPYYFRLNNKIYLYQRADNLSHAYHISNIWNIKHINDYSNESYDKNVEYLPDTIVYYIEDNKVSDIQGEGKNVLMVYNFENKTFYGALLQLEE